MRTAYIKIDEMDVRVICDFDSEQTYPQQAFVGNEDISSLIDAVDEHYWDVIRDKCDDYFIEQMKDVEAENGDAVFEMTRYSMEWR